MVCELFTNLSSVMDLLVWPTSCYYYIYLVVLGGIFTTLFLSLYFLEKERIGRADAISSLGVSSIATLFLALIGTLIKNSEGIPMIQQNIFLYILAFTIVFIALWFFKK